MSKHRKKVQSPKWEVVGGFFFQCPDCKTNMGRIVGREGATGIIVCGCGFSCHYKFIKCQLNRYADIELTHFERGERVN